MVEVGRDPNAMSVGRFDNGGIDLRPHDLVLPELSIEVIDPHFNDIGMEGNELLQHTVGLRGGGRAIDMREAGGFGRHGTFDTKPIDGRV